jgi:hypothetical protein
MSIIEKLKLNRPLLSDSSLKTYTSILNSLHDKVFGETEMVLSDYDNTDKILLYLENLPPNKRKTILSALFVLTQNPKYRVDMLEDINAYTDYLKTHEKSDVEKENWRSTDDIQNIYNKLRNEANVLYKNKGEISMENIQKIQDLIIVCLCSGIFIPPRRSLDWCAMKIKLPINIDIDNYIINNEFVFNTYKTSKFYDQQRVIIPKQLKTIITKWIKINPTTYLLFDKNLNPLTSVKLNQRLNNIFGAKVGVNILRKVYLSTKYEDYHAKKKEMENTALAMGTSVNMIENNYIKK